MLRSAQAIVVPRLSAFCCTRQAGCLAFAIAIGGLCLLSYRTHGLRLLLRPPSSPRPAPGISSIKPTTASPVSYRCAAAGSRNLTVVTAFFNIGKFSKGAVSALRDPKEYWNWMKAYGRVGNAVVAYFDDVAMAAAFGKVRLGLPTRIVMVNRSSLWSFSLQAQIQTIFASPGYPKNYPKSTSDIYVCAMHAKYELMEEAIRENYFGAAVFAWADIGLFRELPAAESNQSFVLRAPCCYAAGTVAFSQVYEMSQQQIETIMRNGVDWVGGGFFLSDGHTMLSFCADYRKHAQALLERGLANHDQSIILAMYSRWAATPPSVTLQVFLPEKGTNPWFHFPYTLRQEWLGEQKAGAAGGQRRSMKCSFILTR